MQYRFIFGCLELKKRSCEIPFPKNIVYSDVVLDKLKISFPAKTRKVKIRKLLTGVPIGRFETLKILHLLEGM